MLHLKIDLNVFIPNNPQDCVNSLSKLSDKRETQRNRAIIHEYMSISRYIAVMFYTIKNIPENDINESLLIGKYYRGEKK